MMSTTAAMHKKKRKDFIPYFLGLVVFLYCSVHLVSFTGTAAQQWSRSAPRVRRALGKTAAVIDQTLNQRADCMMNVCVMWRIHTHQTPLLYAYFANKLFIGKFSTLSTVLLFLLEV